jgi:Ser/Thr protein kinase RdoA (MazF antagonist)
LSQPIFVEPWPQLAGLSVEVIPGGLINSTFAVGAPPCAVLQRVSPIFAPEVHFDIEAVTRHLENKGLSTPLLLPTEDGALWRADPLGHVWRALSWVAGESLQRVVHAEQAFAAARCVARWHAALVDLRHDFVFSRPGVHDTEAHMAGLTRALDQVPHHRLAEQVLPLGYAILEHWARLEVPPAGPLEVCHGDLKISNLRFRGPRDAVALLDLDTLGRQPREVEWGDALRSWCNPQGEDVEHAEADLTLFEAAILGVADVERLPPEAQTRLAVAMERIAVELAARFCRDALEERYFGFNPAVRPTRGEHNLLRAKGQFTLAQSCSARRGRMEEILRRAFR